MIFQGNLAGSLMNFYWQMPNEGYPLNRELVNRKIGSFIVFSFNSSFYTNFLISVAN